MESWIFIWIFGAIVGVYSDTIVYPGKSALLSYSPARGEFPVQSLFGRGYFSYIDNHGIARTVSLEPNPLLGVRVSDNGQLPADFGSNIALRRDQVLNNIQKGDRLKPIKEFDEKPFQDKLDDKEIIFFNASPLDSSTTKVIGGPEQISMDQQLHQQILSVSIPSNNPSGSQAGSANWPAQNTPLMFFNNPPPPKPAVQGIFNPGNPFLNQQPGFAIQNPSFGGVQQNISPLPGQILFYPNAPINSGSSPVTAVPQTSGGQFLLFPSVPNTSDGKAPTSNPIPAVASHAISPASGGVFPASSQLPLVGAITPQTPPSQSPSQSATSSEITSSQLLPNQVASYPSAPMNSATTTAPNNPQEIAPTPILSPSAAGLPIPTTIPGNIYLPASTFPSAVPQQQVFMFQPGNPFLSLNNKKDKPPISWPIPVSTTSAPVINSDHKNPFLPNLQRTDLKSEIPTIQSEIQPSSVKPNPQLEDLISSPTVCDHDSIATTVPEKIKDTPEVEQAKREHFRAHELALAQLAQAQQNNDNNNYQDSDSSMPVASASENSPLYLTANSPLDQAVTSGSTMAFEQTKITAVESDAALQALPVPV